ncbi:MAG TPA: toll/interleukin-1 receptor domain-containing protein [Blastocatellia bacterium]|nr:toll/interleukin-1 receptor domain-containing protein [Blastocatellia bacterium]
MLDEIADVIPSWKRVLLFARKPLLFGVALSVPQGLGYLTRRDAAILGAEGYSSIDPAPLIVSVVIVISAATLPGICILLRGTERGLAIGIVGLMIYYFTAWGCLAQFHLLLPVLTPTVAWYVSQVMGIGWQPHVGQSVRDILPPDRRTVFISYRRQFDEVTARMIKSELKARGFDVFLDVDDLGPSPRFDNRLSEEIERRHSFVLILSPGSLDRCKDDNDWLRLEITHALETGRKIVPVTRGGFELSTDSKLPEQILPLPLHNAVAYSSTYHQAAIQMLVAFLCTAGRREGRASQAFR